MRIVDRIRQNAHSEVSRSELGVILVITAVLYAPVVPFLRPQSWAEWIGYGMVFLGCLGSGIILIVQDRFRRRRPGPTNKCAKCSRELKDISYGELLGEFSHERLYEKAFECRACSVELCGFCVYFAADKLGAERPICPRCSKPVVARGTLVLPG